MAQVALALVLLVSAGLMIRTGQALRTVEPGFTGADHLQTVRISIPSSLIPEPQLVIRTEHDLAGKLRAIPGVTSVGFATEAPMETASPSWDNVFAEGKTYPGNVAPLRRFEDISPGFLHTTGARLVAGRELTWTDVYGLRPMVMISENLAREFWGTPSAAVGKRLRQYPSTPWQEVIGVVQDVRQNGIQEKAPEIVYWPALRRNSSVARAVTFVIRSERAGTEGFLNQVRQAVWSVNASLPLAAVRTMREIYDESLATTSFTLNTNDELTATSNVPEVTAIKVEVPPMDAEKARINPEDGFIVEEVRASAVYPDGHKERIAFRSFLQDAEATLEDAVTPPPPTKKKIVKKKEVADGFSANPKLFRARWIVGIFANPQHFSADTRIEVALKQLGQIDSKPAIVRRVRLALSGDPGWTAFGAEPNRVAAVARLKDLKKRIAKIPAVDVPVMSEEQPYEQRATREFERGNFLTKIGTDLAPDVPAIFPKLPAGAPRNRLTFAKWFFAPGQPLTARVAVNRYWEQLFGTGIVETLENFGSVGEEPSHPELLDWLALHFQNDLHWDMKALLRELVMSATYRQSAASTPALAERDPRNRLLARGPQQRLTAEMVRDQALAASGLLNRELGGPPVMPPQPAGVWNSVYSREKWKVAKGPDRYRRAIYTFVKRTSGYPSSLIFDASDRSTSLPRRIPTNTPLQALVTLNDPVYEEAAAALAARAVREARARSGETILDARIRFESHLVLSRDPTSKELAALRGLFGETASASTTPSLKNASMRFEEKSTQRQENPAMEIPPQAPPLVRC